MQDPALHKAVCLVSRDSTRPDVPWRIRITGNLLEASCSLPLETRHQARYFLGVFSSDSVYISSSPLTVYLNPLSHYPSLAPFSTRSCGSMKRSAPTSP